MKRPFDKPCELSVSAITRTVEGRGGDPQTLECLWDGTMDSDDRTVVVLVTDECGYRDFWEEWMPSERPTGRFIVAPISAVVMCPDSEVE